MGQHARPVQFAHSFPAAAELQLSPKTVSTFRTRILRKMRLHSNAELIRYTVEHELT